MSAEALVAVIAGAILGLAMSMAFVASLAERRRRADLARVLTQTDHLQSVAARAQNGEFDDATDRAERFAALELEALDVFDGVLIRDLTRDKHLAEAYAHVRAALIRLRPRPDDGPPVTDRAPRS